MDLHVAESWFGEARVVALSGVADLSSAPTLVAALTRVVREHGAATIVADLDGLSVLDDVALGALLGASARTREQGGSFSIVCSDVRIERRIRETQLDRIIAVRPSLSATVPETGVS